MKISFLPKSRLGKWTVGFFIICILCVVFICVFAGKLKAADVVFGAIFAIAAIIALIIGIVAVIKGKERSVLVLLTILIGLFALLVIIGSILGLPDLHLPGF